MMTSEVAVSKKEHVELAFDACLITAGIFSAGIFLSVGVVALVGIDTIPVWLQVMSSLMLLATGIAGPVVTWLLYGRKFSAIAVLGALLGAGAAGLLAGSGAILSAPLGWMVSPISTSEFAGPIALLTIISVAFVGVMVWLLVDAARDSMPARRAHWRVDVARMISAAAIVVMAVSVTVSTLSNPAGDMGEAIIFALVSGIAGGLVVAGADLLTVYVGREKSDSRGAAPV